MAVFLQDGLQNHAVSLFLGMDLLRDVTGLPSRTDLARDMARRYHLGESFSLADVAQRVSQAGNRFESTDFIRTALDTSGKLPSAFHQGIVALVQEHGISTIITTAYDNLLEVAFQQAGMGINRVVRDSDVSFIHPERPTLIKLYGDAQQPDTLVVTDRDHALLLHDRDKEDVIDEVRRAFKRHTILFYGYNLSDPDFKFLFDQIADSKFARLAYAVWPGLPEADVRMWRDRGIVILEEDPLGILSRAYAMSSIGTALHAEIDVRPDPAATAQHPRPEPEQSEWNFETIRSLLTAAFSDSELTNFCFDHFSEVYETFGNSMSKPQKIQELLEYCRRHLEVEDLIRLVEAQNASQYARFAAALRK
jgi:hypothetical protein